MLLFIFQQVNKLKLGDNESINKIKVIKPKDCSMFFYMHNEMFEGDKNHSGKFYKVFLSKYNN